MITTEHHEPVEEIDRCRPWIEAALKKGEFNGVATHLFEDVRAMILTGNAQLWSTDLGCMVTYITSFPRARILTVWLCGGQFDDVMDKMEERITQYAKQNGCATINVTGRKGWQRKLLAAGFEPHHFIVIKQLC